MSARSRSTNNALIIESDAICLHEETVLSLNTLGEIVVFQMQGSGRPVVGSIQSSQRVMGERRKACQNCKKFKCRQKCARCLEAYYCNKECQKQDWTNGHLRKCHLKVADEEYIFVLKAAKEHDFCIDHHSASLALYTRLQVKDIDSHVNRGRTRFINPRRNFTLENAWVDVEGKQYEFLSAVKFPGSEVKNKSVLRSEEEQNSQDHTPIASVNAKEEIVLKCKDKLRQSIGSREAVAALFQELNYGQFE